MTRKPAEVVRAIKQKVASVRTARAQPKAKSVEAPPVAPETATHCPQGAPWCCLVCGNATTDATCAVDGSQGKP